MDSSCYQGCIRTCYWTHFYAVVIKAVYVRVTEHKAVYVRVTEHKAVNVRVTEHKAVYVRVTEHIYIQYK